MDYVPYDPAILENLSQYLKNAGGVIFGSCLILFAFCLLPSIVTRLAKIFTKI